MKTAAPQSAYNVLLAVAAAFGIVYIGLSANGANGKEPGVIVIRIVEICCIAFVSKTSIPE